MNGSPAHHVGIVILNWENQPATSRCLRSLEAVRRPPHVTYLVDNGSTDGSLERLESEFRASEVVWLRNGRNLGFAAGCNPGIERALADGCEAVLLLNNDCIVPSPDFLEAAVERLGSDPRIGVVGGKILRWPDTGVIWCTGGTISWSGERYIGMGERDRGQFDRPAERRFVSGALMLVRRAVFERVGLLPEAYFFGHEDWEFGLRVRRSGFRLVYEPRFVVHHEAGHSHDARSRTYLYNDTLGKILFKRRTLGKASYRLWRGFYGGYLRAGLPVRAQLQRHRLLEGVDPRRLRETMLEAFRDSRGLERITLETLEAYRARHREAAPDTRA